MTNVVTYMVSTFQLFPTLIAALPDGCRARARLRLLAARARLRARPRARRTRAGVAHVGTFVRGAGQQGRTHVVA